MSKKLFGLIGKNIDYSFSQKYFSEKFSNEPFLDCEYRNFDINEIDFFTEITKNNQNLKGLNVTIPYKKTVIPFLNKLSVKAAKIGAVNVIRFTKKGNLKGYNSDCYGFKKALKPLLESHHKKALILGTGGASKAVAYALDELDITYTFVSREPTNSSIDYDIIINCTPLGTSPNIKEFPLIPYNFFSEKHIAFDLIYNPEETQFLKKAKKKGAICKNGLDMLVFQAEKSWEIWNR